MLAESLSLKGKTCFPVNPDGSPAVSAVRCH